jgi:glycosyltransferase involved in cell wall biosynthesis
MRESLNIFVPHCSDLLTDHLPHGDGLIAHGFITNLARRGHHLHVAAQRVDVREPLHRNITVHQIPLARVGRIPSRIEYMFRLRSLFSRLKKDHRFDLIHQLNPVYTGVSLSLAGSGLPLVLGTYVARWPDDPDSIASRGKWIGGALALGRSLISQAQQRNADAILLTTPAACNRLPRPNAVRDRVHMLPHGLDTELFCPETGWDSDARVLAGQENPSILFFANVVARKGILTLVDAFSTVAREIPNSLLRIAGDGPALAEVKRRVAGLSCAGRIEFLGRQERALAPRLYRDCSVYCLPSHGEPYATTVLEAMSCGKPVVVTNAGGLPYMVHERGGKRVPVGDSVSLANALIELLRDPSQRLAMGRYNRELVATTMTWEHVAQQLEEIYRQTLQRVASTRHGDRRSEVLVLDQASDSGVQERV